MTAYYNEIDPFAASWLRELIKAGVIAPGEVDERSIEDVNPANLVGFDQCHFFAGIGIWSYALRSAGWPDDRPVWSGSCPCQPFSAAGKGKGFDDERHLWPAWFYLIEVCRPPFVFGEQVSKKNGRTWFQLVQSDLEGIGYAVGDLSFPACSIGAPHIRERMYFCGMADTDSERFEQHPFLREEPGTHIEASRSSETGSRRMENAEYRGRNGRLLQRSGEGPSPDESGASSLFKRSSNAGFAVGDSRSERLAIGPRQEIRHRTVRDERTAAPAPGPVNGFWGNADWIPCRNPNRPGEIDYRPVEPGTFPLAHGATARVGRLRGYGNCLVAPQAIEFITAVQSYMKGES